MRISKYILSPQEKPFVSHTRHPEPVLSTALKCSARDEKRCGIHATLMNQIPTKINFNFALRTICSH
jgi:hypothetical protein